MQKSQKFIIIIFYLHSNRYLSITTVDGAPATETPKKRHIINKKFQLIREKFEKWRRVSKRN